MNKPLFLKPSGKDYIWGGNRLKTEFNKEINVFPLAETWECSTHPDGASYIVRGEFSGMTLSDVISHHPNFLGTKYSGLNELPILVKFIDAESDLSVQVHPDDAYAYEFENKQLGKTEMWYVLDACEGSSLVYGFSKDVDKETIKQSISSGTLMDYLHRVPVKKGDYFFINAGTVHAIGAGTMIAEIQENSNLTYRLYDYNRVGKDGKLRELHVEKALQVLNLKSHDSEAAKADNTDAACGHEFKHLCACKYFDVSVLSVDAKPISYRADETVFRVLLCIDGAGAITTNETSTPYRKGDCIFVPADSEALTISGRSQFLSIVG